MKQPTSGIIYQGPSVLDGQPIVAVAVLTKTNAKTGPMLQTYILRADIDPIAASKTKQDESVCGACPQRRSLGGACYVTLHHGPLAVFNAYQRGSYQPADTATRMALGKGQMVRLGTYGDPAAVPYYVWQSLIAEATGWTGYTHQSRHPKFDRDILDLCMVSADTLGVAEKAWAKNRRTFRIMGKDDSLQVGEIECLADTLGKTCAECGLCNGGGSTPSGKDGYAGRLNVAIRVHGALAGRYDSKYGRINLVPASA